MTTLLLGLILFLGVHSVSIVAPAWRDRMEARLGRVPWKIGYALVAVLGLWLIIRGYNQAPAIVVWSPPVWTRHLAATLMLPAFSLLLAAYLPGRIKAATKHPMLVATKLWATSHLLANGMLADMLLFGAFLTWAVADRISLKRRPPRPLPISAQPRARNDLIATLGGLALYALFIHWAHRALFGVAPFG